MKTTMLVLSASLISSIVGCGQQTDLTAQPAVSKEESVQKNSKTGTQVINTKKIPSESIPQPVENIKVKDGSALKESTEQSLAKISTDSREITGSQESKSRSRAQIAEDEMLEDLKSFNK